MIKFDPTKILKAKTQGSLITAMKGDGWEMPQANDGWIYPVPQSGGNGVFTGTVTKEPDGTYKVTATTAGGSNGRCSIPVPPPGTKIEFESHLDRAGSSSRLIMRQVTSNTQTQGTSIYDVNGPPDTQLHRTDIITIGAGITLLHIIGVHPYLGFFKVLPTTRYRILPE